MSGLSLPEKDRNTLHILITIVYIHIVPYTRVQLKMLNSFTHVRHVLPLQVPLLQHRIQVIPRLFSHLHHLAVHPLGQLVCQ